MKRLMAILAFLFGGLSVEVVKPVDCSLIESAQQRTRRIKPDGSEVEPGEGGLR